MAGPKGLNAARKLRNNRREQRWSDLHYKKRALGTAFKSSPFGGSSHAKGIVLEKVGVEAKPADEEWAEQERLSTGPIQLGKKKRRAVEAEEREKAGKREVGFGEEKSVFHGAVCS